MIKKVLKKIIPKKKLSRIISFWTILVFFIACCAITEYTYNDLFKVSDKLANIVAIIGVSDTVKNIDTKTQEYYDVELNAEYGAKSTEELKECIGGGQRREWRLSLTDNSGVIVSTEYEPYMGMNVSDITTLDSLPNDFKTLKTPLTVNGNDSADGGDKDDPTDTERFFLYGLRLNDESGWLVAFVPVEDHVRTAESFAVSAAMNHRVGTFGYVFLVDENNKIISHVEMDKRGEEFDHPEILRSFDDPSAERAEQTSSYITEWFSGSFCTGTGEFYDKGECYYAVSKAYSYYVVSIYPMSDALDPLYSTLLYTIEMQILVFVVLFIAIKLIVWLVLVKKLHSVNRSLGEIAAGNLNVRVKQHSAWEFRELSDDINAVVDRLKGYISEAEARYDNDLAMAKEIQTSALPNIFPPFPDRKEFDLYATMNAAKEVGGDFYDFYMLGENTLGFLIADVSGKSIPGAMFMMRAKSVIKSLAESGMQPAEVFTEANESLCENNEAEMFVTAWLGYLELDTGVVHIASAGHNPPLLIHNGTAEYLGLRPGLILAGLDGTRYREQQIQLEKGDILFLYTDGVTEAMDIEEKLYGEQRLKNILSFDERELPGDEQGVVGAVCRRVKADVSLFTGEAEQSDDITMLCLKFNGREKEERNND